MKYSDPLRMWAIESGWTVAEIAAGLYMGLLEKQLGLHYND